MELVVDAKRGYRYGRDYQGGRQPTEPATTTTALAEYFDQHQTGPGMSKWLHYFSVYERHFAKFRGREVHVVEIGIWSGGSLGMWKTYFGDNARVYGVDIEPACQVYEGPGVRVFIGDQSDPGFWDRFIEEVPTVDIVIDDGGHEPGQQIVTLEKLLPHLQPGGVYLCEDIVGRFNPFHAFLFGLSLNLHVAPGGAVRTTDLQRTVEAVHWYPFLAVVEKRADRVDELNAPRHGSEWQSFLG